MIWVEVKDIKQVMIPVSKEFINNLVQAGAAAIFKVQITKEKFLKIAK